ncbi:MAG: hypothetical protein WA696_02125, partial [Solirubrobacterales bacterium]
MPVTALAPGINPGINLSGTQENSGDLGELELTPEQARDRRAVDLITRRSRVRIPPPLLEKGPQSRPFLVSAARDVSIRRPNFVPFLPPRG